MVKIKISKYIEIWKVYRVKLISVLVIKGGK